ncbi:hypothetical protein BBJ28_00024314 [Nothophytophthora sp. Chile5]|nr:hypothetical protein BBJ28_00024314 [Nothophytophthora sp. Chile5]
MEQIAELPNGKCIRKYSPEHPLFAAGTLRWASKYYQEPAYAPASMRQTDELDDDEGQEQDAPFECRLANCNVSFQSVAGYEEHYDMYVFAFGSETHDAFFKILSKQKPMYVCLVDGCTETFRHDDKRMRHLIQTHQYPESFSFRQRHKRPKAVDTHAKHGKDDNQQEVDTGTIKKREARKRRRQRKKERFNQGQSGDAPPQVDVKTDAGIVSDEEPHRQEMADVDMMELETSMSALRIPKQIRFGRKRQI